MYAVQYIQSLATQTNAKPLPPVEEVFGVRLPQDPSDVLTAINFDLIPNKPPPGVTLYDEEIEEVESSDEEEAPPTAPVHRQEEEEEEDGDEDMEPAVPLQRQVPHPQEPVYEDTPFPVSAIATPGDVHMFGTPNANAEAEAEEDDGLFSGGDDDDDSDAVAEEVLLVYCVVDVCSLAVRLQMPFKKYANSKRKRITISYIQNRHYCNTHASFYDFLCNAIATSNASTVKIAISIANQPVVSTSSGMDTIRTVSKLPVTRNFVEGLKDIVVGGKSCAWNIVATG